MSPDFCKKLRTYEGNTICISTNVNANSIYEQIPKIKIKLFDFKNFKPCLNLVIKFSLLIFFQLMVGILNMKKLKLQINMLLHP